MTKVTWPMLSLAAHGKTSCPIDSSDMSYDPVKKRWSIAWHNEKFLGLENGKALLQETEKKIELEWGLKAVYREQPCWFGHITLRQKYYRPTNPQTTIQQLNRQKFSDAVDAWQDLGWEEEVYWNKLKYPIHMSGYNRFLRAFMLDQI